ncbi:MAG: VanZ family protein [Lachnospiraceae bacterium]|nr:VanZ family protein [Lachnospiraceae bacterium]
MIRIAGFVMFVCYLLALTYFLFFAESYGRAIQDRQYSYNLTPLKEIKRFWTYRESLGLMAVFLNLAGNVLAFVPFGAILPVLWNRTRGFIRIGVMTFEFSLLVETIQLVSKVGSFDVDDLLLNTLGGILGYAAFVVCNYMRRKLYG